MTTPASTGPASPPSTALTWKQPAIRLHPAVLGQLTSEPGPRCASRLTTTTSGSQSRQGPRVRLPLNSFSRPRTESDPVRAAPVVEPIASATQPGSDMLVAAASERPPGETPVPAASITRGVAALPPMHPLAASRKRTRVGTASRDRLPSADDIPDVSTNRRAILRLGVSRAGRPQRPTTRGLTGGTWYSVASRRASDEPDGDSDGVSEASVFPDGS